METAAAAKEVLNSHNAAAKVISSTMATIDLYYLPPSPPCRAVMLTAKAVGVELNLKMCNILEGDNLKPEYLKLNPQHTIPTMDDNGLVIWESRPIMSYLVSEYGKSDALYPKEPRARALVDHRLYFDATTLFLRYLEYFVIPAFSGGTLDDAKKARLSEALEWFDTLLEGRTFAAGDEMTIADITLVVTVSSIETVPFDLSSYENIQNWYERTKEALEPYGYEEINQTGANILSQMLRGKLGS